VLPVEYEAMHLVELSHWWFRGRRRVLVDLLGEVAGPRAGSLRILDYGCGTGGNTQAYASLGIVFGVEPDAAAVKLASERGGACYCRASGTKLPFREAAFDAVVASDVLEHIDDDSSAVAEITRVLRPGGSAVISVPAHQWLFSEHDAALHHFRRYSKAVLRDVLERGGLRIRRLSYWNAALFPVVCLRRLLPRRHSGSPRSDTRPTPWLLNETLTALLAAEATILRYTPLPWGVSLIGVAERV
jgi:SAM-dependent methyltransferase